MKFCVASIFFSGILLHGTKEVKAFIPKKVATLTRAHTPSTFLTKEITTRSLIASTPSTTTTKLYMSMDDDNDATKNNQAELQEFDSLLQEGKLRSANRYLTDHPSMEISSKSVWKNIFDAIEIRTSEAEENSNNFRGNGGDDELAEYQQTAGNGSVEYPLESPARTEMTNMYALLQSRGDLRLYGSASSSLSDTTAAAAAPAVGGSHIVTPTLLEQVTELPMTALTPKPTNTLLIAGVVVAVVEGLISLNTGIDLNLLVWATLTFAFLDKLILNGALFESALKIVLPGIQKKITRHEAGHFLCAYLMGCPVEGCVLSAWGALQDARFGGRNRASVSAGTSFFDPILSKQINSSVVTRSSIDRYSIIVMGGIAAEALNFGGADGGAGDEAALVSFLSQLNSCRSTTTNGQSVLPPWNEISIKNQARWGALSAVLLLKEYRPAYEALVDALERGGNLGDCIYAIEKAGRDNNLQPLEKPLGYILDQGQYGEWVTELPPQEEEELLSLGPYSTAIAQAEKEELGTALTSNVATVKKVDTRSPEQIIQETEEALQEYRKLMEEKLQSIDEQLKNMDDR